MGEKRSKSQETHNWNKQIKVTPFIQSTAGIMVGARTGLSAVVCGSLFLISTLFASPIASVIPLAATGPVLFVACLPVVQGLRYLDFSSPVRVIPAFLAFFLMTLTNSIGVGVSFSFVILFGSFALTEDWVLLTPQMVCSFFVCTVLLLVETGLVTSMDVLGAIVGGFAVASIVISLAMAYPLKGYFYSNPGLVTNSHSHNNHSDAVPMSSPSSKNYRSSKGQQASRPQSPTNTNTIDSIADDRAATTTYSQADDRA